MFPPRGVHLAKAQNARGLRHAFNQQHSRHDRVVGEVAEKMRLVERHVFDSDAVILAANIDDAIDHDKGIAMRQQPQDFADIGDLDRLAAPSSASSALRLRRTRRRSVATPRFHSITGSAGKPPQRAPAGTLDITPAFAPSIAPSPIVKWSAMPTCPANTAKSPTVTLPDMPTCETIRQCL